MLTAAPISGDGSGTVFQNDGTVTQTTGLTDTSYIETTYSQTATGLTEVESGTLEFDGATTISGTIEATTGGIVNMATSPTNLSSGTLTGGTWDVVGASTISFGGDITTNAAEIVLDGDGAEHR